MREAMKTHFGHRVLALLMAAVLLVQLMPAVQAHDEQPAADLAEIAQQEQTAQAEQSTAQENARPEEPADLVNESVPKPAAAAEAFPFSAKIGETELEITEGSGEFCEKMYSDVPVYIVQIPEGETADTFTLDAPGCAYVKDGGCSGRTWDITEPLELPILKGKTYHVRKGWEETFHIGFHRADDAPLAPKVPEISAKIGNRALEITQSADAAYPCTATQTYEIKVPESLKDQPVIIDGLKDYAYRPVTDGATCDGAMQAWDGSAAVNEYGYHFAVEQGYAPDYQNIHIRFTLFKEEAPKAPFTVTLGDQELKVDLLPPTSEYGPKGIIVHVPSPFAKTVTFHNVKDWTYMQKNQEIGQLFTIETNDWETQILGPKDFFLLSNWPDRYRVSYEVADAAEANIVINAQMDGRFLLPPETRASLAPGLAKSLGYVYGDGVTEGDVTLLDALVKMHQLKYPDEDVTKYLALDQQGTITKAFGVEPVSAGFMINGRICKDQVNDTCIGDGDTIGFFDAHDPNTGDRMVSLAQNGVKKTHFNAGVGIPLELTVVEENETGTPSAVAGVQIAAVAQDGTMTPMEGRTDENGRIRVTFAQAGEHTITVVGSAQDRIIMPVAHVTASETVVTIGIEARTAGKGDFLPATVLAVDADTQKTVKELLDECAREFGLNVGYTANGGLESINDLRGVDGGWRYYVNEQDGTESVAQRRVSAGDVIRIRYAVTASADELKAPLYAYLKTLVAQAKDKLTMAYTQQTKDVLQTAVTAADAVLQDVSNNSTDTDKELLVSEHIALVNAGIAQLVPEKTAVDPAIPEDFENDLWLQYDYKAMAVGDTATIYPRRIPQIIDDPISNKVTRPVFRFEVVKGDSVTLSEAATREKTTVTAVKEGTSVVKVTYDAEGAYGPCSPVNEGYVVFHVGAGEGSVRISTSLSEIRSYDTVYYTGADTTDHTFTVSAPGAVRVDVTCNDLPVTPNDDGTYTAKLENKSNVIGIQAADDQGRVWTYYQTVDARKIQVVVDNKTSPGKPFKINDTARISFRGITMPVAKLATIYNPCFGEENPRTHVFYRNEQLGELKGYCNQYDLATKNSFEVTFTQAGDYAFTGGRIHCAWWGDKLGSDKQKEGSGNPNMGAAVVQDDFSWMPDFVIHVANELSDNIPVTGIQLNRRELALKEGESFLLEAKLLPVDATNQKITWSCDDPSGFFLSLDKDTGRITANHATTQEKPVITVTATTDDGKKTASCTVTVEPILHTVSVENGTADPDSAARKTLVTIQADQAPEGQQFDHWDVVDGSVSLKDSSQSRTSFVMPDHDVSVKAVFVKVKEPDRKPGGSTHSYSADKDPKSKDGSNTTDAQVVDGVVSAKELETIKGKDENLRITGKLEDGRKFIWTINGRDIKKAADLKVGMSRKGQHETDIGKLAEHAEIFSFAETGDFPAPMQVELPTDLADGSYLLMRYNPEGRNAEKISKVEVKDGMVKFIAQQGGEYFLAKRVSSKSVPELEAAAQDSVPQTEPTAVTQTTERPEQIDDTGSGNAMTAGIIVIVAAAAAGCAWFALRKRKESK